MRRLLGLLFVFAFVSLPLISHAVTASLASSSATLVAGEAPGSATLTWNVQGGISPYYYARVWTVESMGSNSLISIVVTKNGYYGATSGTESITVSSGSVLYLELVKAAGGTNQTLDKSEVWLQTVGDLAPQTVTLTSSSLAQKLIPGQTIQFTASGSASGQYVWDHENGGLTVSGNTALFVAGVAGQPAVVSVYAPETDTHAQSNVASATIAVVAGEHRVNIRLPGNPSNRPISVLISQDGNAVHTMEVPPGATPQIFTLTVPSGSPVTVTAFADGYDLGDNGIWTEVPNAVGPSTVKVIDPFADWDGDTDPEEPPPPPPSDVPPPDTPKPPPAPSKKNVWQTVNSTNVTGGTTAEQYAEGVDKITAAVAGISDLMKGNVPVPDAADTGSGDVELSGGFFASLLPEIPEIQMAPAVSSISFVLAVPNGSGGETSLNVGFDAAPYESQINIFRTIFAGAMSIGFFILYVSTIRKAFAT